jgi:hypothetical protein
MHHHHVIALAQMHHERNQEMARAARLAESRRSQSPRRALPWWPGKPRRRAVLRHRVAANR